jgi:UDPglucose 6-dehydrogenase
VVEESQGVMIARALAAAGHAVLIADPVALESASAVLGDTVTPMSTAEAAVAAATVIVVTNPDRSFAALAPASFTGKAIVDCWRILPESVAELADVIHLGRGA